MNPIGPLLLIVLLAAPVSVANHIVLDDVPDDMEVVARETTIAVGSGASAVQTTWTGVDRPVLLGGFTVDDTTTLEGHNRTHFVEVAMVIYWTESSDGFGLMQMHLNNTAVDNCLAVARTINGDLAGILGAQQVQASGVLHTFHCELSDLAPGSYGTSALELRFTNFSGNPAPVQSFSVGTRITQVDYTVIPMDLNFSAELQDFIWLLAMTALLIFFLDRKAILPAATVTIAGLLLVIPIVTDPLAWGVIGLYLFLWLHYAAKNGLTQVGRDDREGV